MPIYKHARTYWKRQNTLFQDPNLVGVFNCKMYSHINTKSSIAKQWMYTCMQEHCRTQNTLFCVPKSSGTAWVREFMSTGIFSLIQKCNIHTQASTQQERGSTASCAISMRSASTLEPRPIQHVLQHTVQTHSSARQVRAHVNLNTTQKATWQVVHIPEPKSHSSHLTTYRSTTLLQDLTINIQDKDSAYETPWRLNVRSDTVGPRYAVWVQNVTLNIHDINLV